VYEEYKLLLKTRLDEYRFYHSLCVADEAKRLAEKYGCDVERAYLAGLLHDITKNDTPQQQIELINKYNIPADEAQLRYYKLQHSITAPYVMKYELGITDEEILSAVRYHTTGRAGMTLLEKLLYVADYVDPTRDYEDVDFYRKLAFADIDRAAFLCLAYTMEDLSGNKGFIHKDTYDAYQYYVRYYEDNPDKKFDENSLRI
jgi:predicted HD superfamily hydrolase involved in NAD metabolism